MKIKKYKYFDFKNDLLFYIIVFIIYTGFLFNKYVVPPPEAYNSLYDNFLFLFDSSLSEFKEWYPRFGFGLYIFSWILKVVYYFLIAKIIHIIIILLYRQFLKSQNWEDFYFESHVIKQVTINIVILSFYIVLYYVSKTFYSFQSFNFQVLLTRGYLLQFIVQIIINCIHHRGKLLIYFTDFFLQPQLPFNIAILRILFFLVLIFIYIYFYLFYLPIISLKAKVALPFIGWFIDILPVNVEIYEGFFFLGLVCCIFIIIGFKTRLFLILNSICVFYLIATPNFFGKLWNLQLFIWISWFFTFSRCYDVFSVDSKLKNTPLIKSADYTFPVRFVWLQLGIIYFWSGFYKLWDSGFDWALGQTMINQIQLEWVQHYDKIPSFRIDQYPLILHIGGILVILFELSYILFLLKPKWRWFSALGGLLMHNFIGTFMYIYFFIIQIIYVFYFDFNQLFNKFEVNIVRRFSKKAFYFGLVIIFFNFCFGMFHIDSYPFSSYPSYSSIIPNRVKIIDFRCQGLNSTVHEVGKLNNFRWEDYGWLENNLIADFESGKDVQKRLEDYWEIWSTMNSQLQACDTIYANLIERPVSPEGFKNIAFIKKMGFIYTKK